MVKKTELKIQLLRDYYHQVLSKAWAIYTNILLQYMLIEGLCELMDV